MMNSVPDEYSRRQNPLKLHLMAYVGCDEVLILLRHKDSVMYDFDLWTKESVTAGLAAGS
jgi:hypothetical protein